MSTPAAFDVLTREVGALYGLFSLGHTLLLIFLFLAAVLIGRAARAFVYVIWRLGMDPGRRLSPLGTVTQVGLCFAIFVRAFQALVSVAPLATFVHLVAAFPALLWLLAEPTKNALAGLSILFRRSLKEGDRVILDSGEAGQVRQIRLTTTVARTEAGGRLLIPNRKLLEGVIVVDHKQAGVRLSMRFPLLDHPSDAQNARIKTILALSPYRAAGSKVSVSYDRNTSELEVNLRIFRATAEDAARRELSRKIAPLLLPGSPPEEAA